MKPTDNQRTKGVNMLRKVLRACAPEPFKKQKSLTWLCKRGQHLPECHKKSSKIYHFLFRFQGVNMLRILHSVYQLFLSVNNPPDFIDRELVKLSHFPIIRALAV